MNELLVVLTAALIAFAVLFFAFSLKRTRNDKPEQIHLCGRHQCNCRKDDPAPPA